MKKHQGPVAFISVSDLIREKSINYNRNLPMETGVISTSFMAPDSENVKDSHGDDLDCFDEDCGYSPADWRVKPGNKTIINSSQTATSQFSENSSLRHPPPLACQLTPGRTKSPKLQSQLGTAAGPGGPSACDMSQIIARKDDSGYGDDLSLIDDLDSLDDPLPASKHITDDAMIPTLTTPALRSGSGLKFWLREIRDSEETEVAALSDITSIKPGVGSVSQTLAEIKTKTATILNICDSLQRMDTSDNSSLLLFSTLARGLRHKVKTFVHFYCGITENFGLPGYVFRNSGFKIELLQYYDCIENICDKMMKILMHSNDMIAIRNLIKKVRQLFLSSLNVIIGSQLARSLKDSPVGVDTLDSVLSACISSLAVSGEVARLGGVDSLVRELAQGREEARLLRLLGCLCAGEVRLPPSLLPPVLHILGDQGRPEDVRREAVGVLAQLTAAKPSQPQLVTFVNNNLQQLLSAIQGLVKSSTSHETFLLCSASLSNITGITAQASLSILSCSLLPSLLSHPAITADTASVYILEQMVTLLNNLARETVMSGAALSGSVEFLLDLLLLARHRPANTELYSATHRTVSKAVIGLARLCLRPESASEILRLGGLERLGEVAGQEMFDDDETVKLAVVAAVTSVNTDFSESFV